MQERRKKFFIDKPLQLRYMIYIALPFTVISFVTLISLYLGIWGGVLDAFSDERIRNDLLIASRLTEYEEARMPAADTSASALSFLKQSEKLSQRQREVFKDILDETNRKLFTKFFFLLIFIVWGSIYVSHKIAGPLYRFHVTLEEVIRGNLRTRVHLRKLDEAQSVASAFNRMLESLDFAFTRLKNIVRENESNAERMSSRLKDELSKFRTSADR